MRSIIAVALLLVLFLPALSHAEDSNLQWGLKILKETSGMIGAAEACNNVSIKNDATRVYQSTLKSLVKNGIIRGGEVSHIIDMGAETAIKVKNDFLKDGAVSCTDLHEVWQTIRADAGL